MNTKALRDLSYGVYVVATPDENRYAGCVANSAMQITSSPATVALSINHDNYTNSCIQKSGMFSLSILREQSNPSIIGTFGFQSSRDTDKFASVPYELRSGVPVLKDARGYLVCKVVNKMETSTHTVFLGEIIDADLLQNGQPMSYSYYHNVIKGKTAKNAPTYLPEEPEKKNAIWRCPICGYEYTGDIPFEELPDDYVCPICGAPKKVFEKIG